MFVKRTRFVACHVKNEKKLRTVAASNNRVHMPWSLYYCLFAPHICMVLFFTHIPFVVNHTINAIPPEWLQQLHSHRRSWSHCRLMSRLLRNDRDSLIARQHQLNRSGCLEEWTQLPGILKLVHFTVMKIIQLTSKCLLSEHVSLLAMLRTRTCFRKKSFPRKESDTKDFF